MAASTASAIMVHQDGKFVYANPTALRIIGYSEEELFRMNFWESVHPDFQKLVRQRGEARQRGEDVPERYEIQLVRKNDAAIWVDISSGAITWKGRPSVITSFFEITARKELEERLRTLSTAVEQSANTIVITDTDGNIQYVNPKFTELTGYTAAEAQGLNLRILNARTQPAALYEDMWGAISAGRVWRGELHNKKKNGELYWEQATISPLWDEENKKITNYLAVKEDITARKNAEQALLASEEKFRLLTESSPDIVAHISLEGTILYVSPAKGAFRGYTPAEVIGTNVSGYFAREEDMERGFAEIQKIIETRQSGRFEFLANAKEGEPFEVENHYAPLMEDGRVASLLFLMRDVSERKQAEKERARAHKLESVGILAGGIAHDFNNIMTGIFGNLQLAKLKIAEDHPAHKYIFRAWEATERATHLTKQLLTFSRGGEPILEAVGVKEVIEKIVSFNLTGSSVKAILDFPEKLWPLKADSGQFGQLIANLVINARQAMPDGGVLHIAGENVERLNPVESPGLTASGSFVKLTLKDEGVGIAPDHLGMIFDPYFTTKETGSGLGLATVYSIVKRHNGHIGITSEVGRGTTFTIHLPADLSGQTQNAVSSEEPDGSVHSGGRVMIMDDEELVRMVVGDMFEALGYSADFAGDGGEATAKYREAQASGAPYALVVMDLTIPGGMGGKEAVQNILEINPEAKVIVASGYSNDPVMAHFERYGFRGRMVKPISLEAMKAELARVMK
jgi:PAS domain S-box-containing protein